MDFLDKLNPEQREAVLHREGPLRILAGAGSGKTRVITYRIVYIIGDGHAEPDRCRGDLHQQGRAGDARACRGAHRVGSRPSGCRRSTRSARGCCGARRPRSACRASSSSTTRRPDRGREADRARARHRRQAGAAARGALAHQPGANRMQGPDSLRGTWNIRDEQIAKMFERYVTALHETNALDFDDLLLKTVELLERCGAGARLLRAQVPVRDGGRVPGHEPSAVPPDSPPRGRPSQSRGGRRPGPVDLQVARCGPAQHPRLRADFAEAKIVRLEQNDRSTQMILDAASAVIRQNQNRKEKRLWTERKGGGRSCTTAGPTSSTKPTSSHVDPGGAPRGSRAVTAVLYRTNAQSRAIEDALMRESIPYRIIGGVRFTSAGRSRTRSPT